MSPLTIDINRLARDPTTVGFITTICEELKRRQNHPGDRYIPDDDVEGDQLSFHKSKARVRLVFGGNQSGKSKCVAQEIKWWLEESHPYQRTPKSPKIYILSADYRTLTEGVYRHLMGANQQPAILQEWNIEKIGPAAAKTEIPAFIRTRSGAQCDFISGEGNEEARRKIQAAAVDLVVIDEEISGVLWKELMARRLAKGGRVTVSATLQRSEEWLLDLEQMSITGDENIHLTRLKTKRAVERGHVSRDVYEEMFTYLSEEDKHVMLEGGSRKRQGLVYPEFCKKHICEPFEIPPAWTRYCGIDPGRRTAAILWLAVPPGEKIVYIYREGYFHGLRYHQLAKFLKESEGYLWNEKSKLWTRTERTEHIRVRWIDPSAYYHTASGEPGIGTLLSSDYKIFCSPAPNDVHFGIEKIHQLLQVGMDEQPGLKVFNTCRSLIKEFGSYRWVEDKGSTWAHERKDSPVKRNDHALDALRYMVAAGIQHDPSQDHLKKLQFELEKGIDLQKMSSGSMKERFEAFWRNRMLKQRNKDHGGPYIGGIGSG
jgi:hypothetical protein